MAWSATSGSMKTLQDDCDDTLLGLVSPGHSSITQGIHQSHCLFDSSSFAYTTMIVCGCPGDLFGQFVVSTLCACLCLYVCVCIYFSNAFNLTYHDLCSFIKVPHLCVCVCACAHVCARACVLTS